MFHRKREGGKSYWGINYSVNENNTLLMLLLKVPITMCCHKDEDEQYDHRIPLYIKLRIRKWWRFKNAKTTSFYMKVEYL
jgi:hypothetical protein